MARREEEHLKTIDRELNRLQARFRKVKSRRDTLSAECGDLKTTLDALWEEKNLLAQGQLLLREAG